MSFWGLLSLCSSRRLAHIVIGNLPTRPRAAPRILASIRTWPCWAVSSSYLKIIHANVASHSVLEKGDLLRSVNGRLTATDAQVDRVLHDAFAVASCSDAETGGKGSALPLPNGIGSNRYVAHVLPLKVGERHKAGMGSKVVAALFVRKAEFESVPPSEVIGKTYNLTPTELRVLLAIVNVGGVRQVAGDLGVADTTIKTHLSRLFEKTGVSRQADLVKLVAGYSSVLVE